MTTHTSIELTPKRRDSLFRRYPKARNLSTHLTADHHMDNATREDWVSAIDAHLDAYAKDTGGIRTRVKELVQMNVRAARRK
jgi:hypothetical protein